VSLIFCPNNYDESLIAYACINNDGTRVLGLNSVVSLVP
jgi:hypothetical protein